MAHTRTVTDLIHDPHGQPWEGFETHFTLAPSAVTTHATLPSETVIATTDANGTYEIELEVDVTYRVVLYTALVVRGSSVDYRDSPVFEIVVPEGDTPISMSTIRAAAITPPDDPTLVNSVAQVASDLSDHEGDTNNPHATTAAQVGAVPRVDANNALGAAGGGLLADGQVTATTYAEDGTLISAANDLLVEGLTRDGHTLGGGAVESVNGQTGAVVLGAADVGALSEDDRRVLPVALGSAWGTQREYPMLTKPLAAAVLDHATQSVAPDLYWPILVDRRAGGGDGVMLMYSTDHEPAGSSNDGIYAATATSPLGPYTDIGRIYVDDVHGAQTETPSVIYNEATGAYHLYYHNYDPGGAPTAEQYTMLATSPDLETWTYVGVMLDAATATHTGYFRPFRIAGSWYGYALFDGTTSPITLALWESGDGITWTKIGEPDVASSDKIDHLTGYTATWIVPWYHGDVILWRGQPWWIGMIRDAWSGATVPYSNLYTGPLTDDLLGFAARPIDITPPAQGWEGGGISQIGNAMYWDGHIYLPYRGGTSVDGFGILEIV